MLTLSEYFPPNTEYFYSYPAGDTFYFYNSGDPVDDELIAARLLVCAGEHVRVVVYHSTVKDKLFEILKNHSDLPFLPTEQIIVLPEDINEKVLGNEKNELITKSLVSLISPGSLVMAQPILDERLMNYYQINSKLSVWLNDKKNLDQYVPSLFLPERYVYFENGREFFDSRINIPLPCVVKMSASSSGEGIKLCHNESDLEEAKSYFKERTGTIFIEKFIPYVQNIGFQFGVPFQKTVFFPPHIVGYNHQVTTKDGVFLGGFILKNEWDRGIEKIKTFIETEILPKVQDMGWYGIGGLDVLIDAQGKFYIIDSNFRTTGMTAYLCLTRNNLISKSMVSFSGSFKGSEKQFIKKVLSLNQGKEKILTVVSLTKKDNEYRFNTALLFDQKSELAGLATKLIDIGIKSEILSMLKEGVAEKI